MTTGDLDRTGMAPPPGQAWDRRRPGSPSSMRRWRLWRGSAIAALVFVGVAAPPIDALLKPFVTEAIFVLLCIAFLSVDPSALRGYLGRPALVLAATAWTMLVIPVGFGVSGLVFGLDARSPALFLALMVQAVASPMMAAPAFAALMGLDATLGLVTLVTATALTPLTAPLFVHAFVGTALTFSPLALGLKLLAILAGSALVGVVIRRIAGPAAIARHRDEIDGFNILAVFVFVAAVMEHVAARFLAAPMGMIGLTALAFAVFFAMLGLTTVLFARAGRERAFALALMASQRNMGLMLAATGEALPDLAWIYFGRRFAQHVEPRPVARDPWLSGRKTALRAHRPRAGSARRSPHGVDLKPSEDL